MPDPVRDSEESPLLAAVNAQRAKIVGLESGDLTSNDHKALFPQLRALNRLWAQIIDRRPSRDISRTANKKGQALAKKTRKVAVARSKQALDQKVQNGTATPDDLTTPFHLFSFK